MGLIITRRIGESVIIGDDVKITVIGTRPGSVKLSVDAPREVAVNREEIYHRKKAAQGGEVEPLGE